MILAIDARDLTTDRRGLGRYARALAREFIARDDLTVVLVVNRWFPARKRAELQSALGSGRFAVSRSIPRDAQVVWHPWNGIFLRSRAPAVVTIADAGPFLFPASDERRREHQQAPFLEAVRNAAAILTISHAAAGDIVRQLGADPQRVAVTYLGVDPVFTPGAKPPAVPGIQRGYFFFVGDVREERKNFEMLYTAFRAAWPAGDGPALVVRGAHDPHREGVVHVAVSDDQTVRSLYCHAIATCVPALYEGFGMPVVESMACATPVIAANASSLPEAGGDAALFLPPGDIEAWTNALRQLASDPDRRQTLREAGLKHAQRFRWERCATETLAVFTAVAAQPGRERARASAARNWPS